MISKYDIDLPLKEDIGRLTNQLWKLIPMREKEENWVLQLETVKNEIVGLRELFPDKLNYLILLSKLEGLLAQETDFMIYRKTVFETISLIRGGIKND